MEVNFKWRRNNTEKLSVLRHFWSLLLATAWIFFQNWGSNGHFDVLNLSKSYLAHKVCHGTQHKEQCHRVDYCNYCDHSFAKLGDINLHLSSSHNFECVFCLSWFAIWPIWLNIKSNVSKTDFHVLFVLPFFWDFNVQISQWIDLTK